MSFILYLLGFLVIRNAVYFDANSALIFMITLRVNQIFGDPRLPQ